MQACIKRTIDIVGATAGLVLTAPLFAVVAVATRMDDGGPTLFAQWRIGRHGRPFRCLKFRTMRVDAEQTLQRWEAENAPQWREYVESNHKLKNDPRVTRIGRILRRSSLDEIPQLINVLLGHMSLVGPRPLLGSEVSVYGREALAYYEQVRPGITGLWQVSGRSGLAFAQRAALDQEYVRRRSLALDAWILLRTLPAVLSRRGAY